MAEKRPVSPGNIGDLIGRFNNLDKASEGSSSSNLLTPDRPSSFRKTSAFVTGNRSAAPQQIRKHSANVLLPTKSALKTKSAYEEEEQQAAAAAASAHLSVSPRPAALKKVSLLTPSYTPSSIGAAAVSPGPVKKVSLLTPTDLGSVQLHTPGVSSSSSSGSSSGSDDERPVQKEREIACGPTLGARNDRDTRKVSEFTLNVTDASLANAVPDRKKTYVVSPGLGGMLAAAASTAKADDSGSTYQSSLNCSNLGRSKSVRCTRVKYGPTSSLEGKTVTFS